MEKFELIWQVEPVGQNMHLNLCGMWIYLTVTYPLFF